MHLTVECKLIAILLKESYNGASETLYFLLAASLLHTLKISSYVLV
jgi:hypothetical protein